MMTEIRNIKEARKGLTVKGKKRIPYCNHRGVILVDEHHRILECEKCGQKIDAFDFMLDIARGNDLYWDKKKEYKQEAIEAAQRLEDLKRKERNTKSRIKRAESKLQKEA